MKIKDCVEDFLYENVLQRKSDETVKVYRKRLKVFEAFCENEMKIADIEDISQITVKRFSMFLIHKDYKATTANSILNVVRLMLRYSCEEGYISSDFSKAFSFQKEEKVVVPAFTAKEVKQLLSECKKSKHNSPRDRYVNARNTAILTVMFDTGIRAGEVCGISNKDVNLEGEFIMIRHGKGDKSRVVPLTIPTRKAIFKYIRIRDEYFSDGRFNLDDALFLTYLGKRMRTAAIEDVFRKLGSDMKRCHPHMTRHTYAVQMVTSQDVSLVELQRLLGHTNLNHTRVYTDSLTSESLIQRTKSKSVLMGIK